ncbi:MAG: MmgE/PrpD family protein [Nocardioides sp.]|uniref:MmgE/PrpD family protein n=1 Tax=Nocardioides sp. TaxID=35761 RepID=UPI003D6C4FC7
MITEDATRSLAEHCDNIARGSLANEVERRARHCVLDHLACAHVGATLGHVQPHYAVMASIAGIPEAMTADGKRRPAVLAAYLNGAAANGLDYDDMLRGHPGAPIVAAALAAGERADATLERLLKAVAVGYEAHWLLTTAANPSSGRLSQVRGSGAFEAIAASLAAAVITDSSPDRLRRVMGVAATHSTVPFVGKWYERPVPTVKNNAGWSAAAGILAVDLVDAGAGGILDALDGPSGFWRMAGSDRWLWEEAFAEVTEPAVLRTGFKRFPACWHTQQYLLALETGLGDLPHERSVHHIQIQGPPDLQKFAETQVLGPADVAFSIRTLSAMLVLGVEPGPAWVSPQSLEAAAHMMHRIEVTVGQDRQIRLTLDNGHVMCLPVREDDHSRPHDFGLSEQEVRNKFDRLLTPKMRAEDRDKLQRSIIGGSPLLQIAELVDHLRA